MQIRNEAVAVVLASSAVSLLTRNAEFRRAIGNEAERCGGRGLSAIGSMLTTELRGDENGDGVVEADATSGIT
jgi:hypothetical protein